MVGCLPPLLQHPQNLRQDPFGILKDIVIPETHYPPALVNQPQRAALVIMRIGMLPTIRLNGKPTLQAGKV